MKRAFLSTVALALAACQSGPTHNFDTEAMDTLLRTAVDSGDVPGASALVFIDGQVVYQNTFGLRDIERNDPIELDTVFRIYSMTKPITSALIMDLVEEGKIALDDPVSKYIPELANMKVASMGEDGVPVFKDQAVPMTIEDLLLHRAGMGYGIYGPINPVEEMYQKAELFDPREDLSVKMTKLSQLPLLAEPGYGWYYSYSIDVLGRVAEIAGGQSFGVLLKERFFIPLGMTETDFHVRADQKSRFASNYNKTETGFELQDDGQTSYFLQDLPFESGGGGLVSTLGDYAKFSQMLVQKGRYNGQQILEPETVAMMMQNQMDADDQFMMDWLGEAKNSGFGYGGSVELAAQEHLPKGAWGWGGMAKTKFHIDPENEAFAILMLQFFQVEDPQIHTDFQKLVTDQLSKASE